MRKPFLGVQALLVVLGSALWGVAPASAAGPRCFQDVMERLARDLRGADASTRTQAWAWVDAFQKGDDELLQRGMLKALQEKELRAFLGSFDNITVHDIPFLPGASKEEKINEMYRKIGRLAGPGYEGVEGLGGTIGHLVASDANNQKGALLELAVGDRVLSQVGDRSTVVFQQRISVPQTGGERIPDVFVKHPSGDPLQGEFYEAKNWPDGLRGEGASFAFLRKYTDVEFPSDILLRAPSDFAGYHVELRDVLKRNVQAGVSEADIVRDELMKVFDTQFIKDQLGAAEAQRQKVLFGDLWNRGVIPTFY